MAYNPKHLHLWRKPEYYAGASWTNYFVLPWGQSRDSSVIERANWHAAKKYIDELVEASGISHVQDATEDDGEAPVFVDTCCSHWAFGWVEAMYLHRDSPDDILRAVDELAESFEDYSVIDECLLSEMEWDEAHEAWENFSLRDRVELCRRFGISIFAARRQEIPKDGTGSLFEYLRQ